MIPSKAIRTYIINKLILQREISNFTREVQGISFFSTPEGGGFPLPKKKTKQSCEENFTSFFFFFSIPFYRTKKKAELQ